MGTTYRRADAVRSRHPKLVLLAATALAAAIPGLAHASSVGVLPAQYDPVYRIMASYGDNGAVDGKENQTGQDISFIGQSSPPNPDYWAAAVNNNYIVPQVYVSARATGNANASASTDFTYYVEFGGPAGGTIDRTVEAYVDLTAGTVDGATSNVPPQASASVSIVSLGAVNPLSLSKSVQSDGFAAGLGTHTATIDQVATFDYDVVYKVHMIVAASAEYGHFAFGVADPYFDLSNLPDGVTFLESAGIGDSLPSTPIPAALPLFGSGLAGLGLLGWRRKKKAGPRAALGVHNGGGSYENL